MMHRSLFALLVFTAVAALLPAAQAQATPPPASLKFFLTQQGIAKIQSLVNPLLMAQLQNLTLPDVTFSSLGIHLNLSSMRLSDFNFTGETVALNVPDAITVTMSGLAVRLAEGVCLFGDWQRR